MSSLSQLHRVVSCYLKITNYCTKQHCNVQDNYEWADIQTFKTNFFKAVFHLNLSVGKKGFFFFLSSFRTFMSHFSSSPTHPIPCGYVKRGPTSLIWELKQRTAEHESATWCMKGTYPVAEHFMEMNHPLYRKRGGFQRSLERSWSFWISGHQEIFEYAVFWKKYVE